MTLAKIDSNGVEFLLESIERGTGKFGEFRTIIGKQNGEPFEMQVSSTRMIKALDKNGDLLKGRVIRIVPTGMGMDKTYRITTLD